MIIGLTGKNGSGKGTVAEFLKKRGFCCFSLSDILRRTLTAKGLPVTRENLITTGNRLRTEGGPGVLADLTLPLITPGVPTVIDSIRSPHEVQSLRRLPGFHLVVVNAPLATRFERCVMRGREGAETTLAAFAAMEARECQTKDDSGQQLNATADLADATLDNSGDPAHLECQLAELLARLEKG